MYGVFEAIQRAFLLGLIPAVLTSLGGFIGLLGVRVSSKYLDMGLSFSAGVMLVASFTSLLLPAIEMSGFTIVLIGFLAGVLVITLLDKYAPHEHLASGYEGPAELRDRISKIWLMIITILIHNLPEGLAVGVVSSIGFREGLLMALAIGIQDIPEGFAVSFPLAMSEKKVKRPLAIAVLSGFSETLMAVIAALIASLSDYLLPLLLALAGGAMIYVVVEEIIPETYKYGNEKYASIGFIIGFLIMLYLDTIFG